ncbi:MAG: hypothetical protein KatS3mg019_2473 [Fimbriimonadales bacterium]|nr:MAG: hypothetical protein KatS3mg019_2473 [Fimbriimonadales bacterium]
MHKRAFLWGLLALGVLLSASAEAQAGTRSYVIRRLYEPRQKQQFNVVYTLRGDVRSSTFEQSLPIAIDAQLRFDTEVLQVLENGQARMRVSQRYVKQSVDYFAETELPPPYTETVKVTPSGFPSEDDAERLVARARGRRQQEREEKREEESFPGLDFLLPPSYFLQLIGVNVVPGPFAPLPPGSVREGDEWEVRYPTPFIDTRGGKLTIEQATIYTYPATVRVVGATEIKGRPVLHVKQMTDAEINIRLDDLLIEISRLRDRNIPRGSIKGTITGEIDYYYALSDGSLVQASGFEKLKLRAEYDPQTVREWEPDEAWAEWEVQANFRQVLAQEQAPASKPQPPQRPTPRTQPRRR